MIIKYYPKILLGFVVILLGFVGCSDVDRSEVSENNHSNYLRINLSENVQSLFPPDMSTNSDLFIGQLVYEGLININASGEFENGIASSILYDSSSSIYIIRIFDSKTFHDHEAVTSTHIYDCFKHLIDMTTENEHINLFRNSIDGYRRYRIRKQYNVGNDTIPEGIRVVDSRTLSIRWLGDESSLKYVLTRPELWIYKNLDEFPNYTGTGPFILEFANSDISYNLRKNENYAHSQLTEEIPYINGVNIRFIKNEEARISEFLNGSLDVIEFNNESISVSANAQQLLNFGKEKYGRYKLTNGSSANVQFLSFHNILNANLRNIIEQTFKPTSSDSEDSIEYFAKRLYYFNTNNKITLPVINKCGNGCYDKYLNLVGKLSKYFDVSSVEEGTLNPNVPYIVLEERKMEFFDKIPIIGLLESAKGRFSDIADKNSIIVILGYKYDKIYSDILLEGIFDYQNWGRNISYMKFKRPRELSMKK